VEDATTLSWSSAAVSESEYASASGLISYEADIDKVRRISAE